MQLFKYLNRTIYILFTVCAFLLLFSNQVQAISITSNINFAMPGQQVVFTSVVQVTGASADILNVFVDYGDGTSEDHIYNTDPYSPRTLSILSNHTYSKPGTYTVRLRATVGGAITIVGPNPVFIRQTVGRLTISRIQLYFENNRPEITIKRNQKPPALSVRIDYSGSGHLKGHWEIDGKRRGYVFKHLNKGPSVILKYPNIPPMPTFQFGSHNVRFVITDPAMNIKFPYAIYFVTSDEKKALASIPLIQPVDGEDITYGSLTFKWKPINKSSVYLISIFSTTKEERIFAAYTRQGEYTLRPDILKARMQPGEKYIWSVTGFNDQNEATAESIPSAFSFNQGTAFLPGQILLITEPN
ncbi:MAG: PKD domain-containing protein, partial [Desulfobacteraceae bacterium]|nr:PKD domain-containing protein [Desulfobacteraceae bacterium]